MNQPVEGGSWANIALAVEERGALPIVVPRPGSIPADAGGSRGQDNGQRTRWESSP